MPFASMKATSRMNAPQPTDEIDEIVSVFEFLGNWTQRYQYIVELGEKLAAMPSQYKTENNRVKGCMSQVWVYAERDGHQADFIRFYGDCDTSVIKGIVALLVRLCSGKTAEEVVQMDLDRLFKRLRLEEHLSPNRHVGVYAIVQLMKEQAQKLID